MRANRLKLHPDKTKFMIFCNRQKKINLEDCILYLDNNDLSSKHKNPSLLQRIECLNLSSDPTVRFLGLILDPYLSFKNHVNMLLKKLSKSIYIIRSVKKLLPKSALLTLYYSLFHSHLMYALPAYGCANMSTLKPIKMLQKKAVRLVTNSKYNAHTDPIFKSLGILKFPDLLQFVRLDFMHSVSKNRCPLAFSDTWDGVNDHDENLNMNLRNYLDYKVPRSRLNFSERLPFHSFPKTWNDGLNTDTKSIIKKKEFKLQVKYVF